MSKIITPAFRGSFVNVLKPRAFSESQDPKFSMVIAIDKEDKFWQQLDKTIKEVATDKWGEVPKKLKTFIKDGDDEEEKYNLQGKRLFTASNKSAPGVLIKTENGLEEVVDPEDIYSGAFYRASIRPYAYEYQNSKGVAISLDNVLKVKDGEKFTSRTTAQDDFKEYLSEDWD